VSTYLFLCDAKRVVTNANCSVREPAQWVVTGTRATSKWKVNVFNEKCYAQVTKPSQHLLCCSGL